MLVVCIVRRAWARCEMVVVAYDVVVRRSGLRHAQVLARVLHSARDSETLRSHLGRLEARLETKLAWTVPSEAIALIAGHSLVYLLLGVDRELIHVVLRNYLGSLARCRLAGTLA